MNWSGTDSGFRVGRLAIALLIAAPFGCGSDKATGPKDTIALSRASVTFQTEYQGAAAAAQTVEIGNLGSASVTDLAATITYASPTAAGWLTAALSATTSPSTLTLTPVLGLEYGGGTYSATVTINGAGAIPRTVAVVVKVASLVGYSTNQGSGISLGSGYLVGVVVTVPSNSTLVSLNTFVNSVPSPSHIKFAVYNSSSQLVASSPEISVVIGRNEAPVTGNLPAGDYLVVVTADNNTNFAFGSAGTTTLYVINPWTYANAFPTTLPTFTTVNDQPLALFMKVNMP